MQNVYQKTDINSKISFFRDKTQLSPKFKRVLKMMRNPNFLQ